MKIIEAVNYEDMSVKAAQFIISQVRENPLSVLGLATGGTVLGTYKYLREMLVDKPGLFKSIQTFNLDEYIGLEPLSPQSYSYFMHDQLFNHFRIEEGQANIPNGMAADIDKECERFENTIRQAGGIDLQLLGIGLNGHIGFNEPGTSFESKTHLVHLAESTRLANRRFFSSDEEVPSHAITMGISTIMSSKKILLLASGKQKAEIIDKLIQGDITEQVPASVLQNHPDVTLISDIDALSVYHSQFVYSSV